MESPGHGLYGIGTDLVSVERLRTHWPAEGSDWSVSRLMQRVLTEPEQQEAHLRWQKDSERGLRYLASRYAAKEALSKAFGTGIGEFFSFQDVSVLNGERGEPIAQFSPRLAQWLAERALAAHLSISDEGGFALAFATLSFNRNTQ